MAWNQPGNNQERDPWGNSDKPNVEDKKKSQQPATDELSELLSKAGQFFSRLGGNKNNNKKNKKNSINPAITLVISGAVLLFIWFVNGFYTIKEAERGVVQRLGKFNRIVLPGLNWLPKYIDKVIPVNVAEVHELSTNGDMLTSDENVVRVAMNVQFRIIDPKAYLFNVINPKHSLQQATDSAARDTIGQYDMDSVLTEGRAIIRNIAQTTLKETINSYQIGIAIIDVNFQAARPPEEVKAAFDDAISARENEQQYIKEAEAYANQLAPLTDGKVARLLAEAKSYKEKIRQQALADAERFTKLLDLYKVSPEITKQYLYIDMMEYIFSRTPKILTFDQENKFMVLPLDKMMKSAYAYNDNALINDADKADFWKDMPKESAHQNMSKTEHNADEKSENFEESRISAENDIIRTGRE